MRFLKFILIGLVTILFIGCSSEDSNPDDPTTQWITYMNMYILPNAMQQKYYDYYEIVDGDITYTHINLDPQNLLNYVSIDDPSYLNSIYDINTTYNIVNPPLDINRTENCMVTYTYDTLTQVRQKNVYIKDFGIYEMSKNYCVYTDNANCNSYVYIRY